MEAFCLANLNLDIQSFNIGRFLVFQYEKSNIGEIFCKHNLEGNPLNA